MLCICLAVGNVVDLGGASTCLAYPSGLLTRVWLLELSHLLGSSFQGLWGLRVLLLSQHVLWDLADGALGRLDFL